MAGKPESKADTVAKTLDTAPLHFRLSLPQRRSLKIGVVLALLAGFYLAANFFAAIVLALITGFMFFPVYRFIHQHVRHDGPAAALTVIIAILVLFIPIAVTVIITMGELQHLLAQLPQADNGSLSLSSVSATLLDTTNQLLATITRGSYQISAAQLQTGLTHALSGAASFVLGILGGSFSSIAGLVTQAILVIYIFMAVLTHSEELLKTVRMLNPLGNAISSLYLSRLGAMTQGIVRGQFVIAICQGFAGAGLLYIAGVHYFFFLALILSFLSLIPLGGGILSIPIGIVMLLLGNVWQGIFVIITHLLIVTNIDNVLRPHLVPRSVRLNSALMMIAVFGGLGLFGFLGIAIGPIIMVLVVSTLEVYATVTQPKRGRATSKKPPNTALRARLT